MKIEFSIKISDEFPFPSQALYKEIIEMSINIAKAFKKELGAEVSTNLDFKDYENKVREVPCNDETD